MSTVIDVVWWALFTVIVAGPILFVAFYPLWRSRKVPANRP